MTRARHIRPQPAVEGLTASLKKVNEDIWHTRQEMRRHEEDQDFGPRFVALARSANAQNDERSRLKRRINELLGARLVEEHSGSMNGTSMQPAASAEDVEAVAETP